MKYQGILVFLLIGLVITACVVQPAASAVSSETPLTKTPTSDPPNQAAPMQSTVSAVATSVIRTQPVDPQPLGQSPQPPAAKLQVGDQTQTAGIGTYCWKGSQENSGPAGLCADMIGIPTAKDPLHVKSPVYLQFEVPVEGLPAELQLTVIPASSTKEKTEPNSLQRWWNFAEGQEYRPELSNSPAIDLQLDPGLYVLDLFVRWDDGNDVSYGFLIQVE